MVRMKILRQAAVTAAFLATVLQAEGAPDKETVFISVNTDNTSMVMTTDEEGQLLFRHYGGRIGSSESFGGYETYRRWDYGTDPQADPAAGGRYFNDAALSVTHGDGDMNTELRYVGHSVRETGDGVTRTEITLADSKGISVRLVYTAYEDEDVIVAFSEIANTGKKAVTLNSYYSSSLPVTCVFRSIATQGFQS